MDDPEYMDDEEISKFTYSKLLGTLTKYQAKRIC